MAPRPLQRLIRPITRWLLPDQCCLCGGATDGNTVCPPCHADLPWIRNGCEACGTPLPLIDPGILCGACQHRRPPFAAAHAPLEYAFPVDALVKALKFGRHLHLAPALADFMLPWLLQEHAQFDALIPVPLHRWRHARRGFNQADELARRLSARSRVPVRLCVRRELQTRSQSGLDSAARKENMRGAFRVTTAPRCRHALLVDDVMTTGATVRELAVTLLEAGVESVSVLTVAHAAMR